MLEKFALTEMFSCQIHTQNKQGAAHHQSNH